MLRIFAFAMSVVLALSAGCGRDDEPRAVSSNSPKFQSGKEQNQEPNQNTAGNTVVGDPLVGTFAQQENQANKLRIDADYRIETNMTIPLEGSGVRITPQLPHRLSFDEQMNSYRTMGFYNLTENYFENIELRAKTYPDGSALDITLVVKVTGGSQGGGQVGTTQPVQNDCCWQPCGPCFDPCMQPCWSPCAHPCWNPCVPHVNPCVQGQGSNNLNPPASSGAASEKYYTYRFIRLEN